MQSVTLITISYIYVSLITACADDSTFTAAQSTRSEVRIAESDAENNKIPDPPQEDVVYTFASSRIESAEIEFIGSSVKSAYSFTLEMETEGILDQASQNFRQPVTDNFTQGSPANSLTEVFTSGIKYGPVDIVVVVDNSGSMAEEQSKLAPKLSSLISKINNASWQIAVTSTDASNESCYRSIIKKSDNPDLNILTDTFEQAINDLGISGSGTEQGILMAKRSLECKPWLQEDSSIAILIVSDEDNCSTGCNNLESGRPPLLNNYLDSIRTPEKTTVFGIIKENNSCTTGYDIGRQYQTSVANSGGNTGDICAPDYSAILTKISEGISKTVPNTFVLSQTPISESVSIEVGGNVTNNFSVQGKTITVNEDIPVNVAIKISYSTTTSSIKTEFDLTALPAPETLTVKVNSVNVPDTNYFMSSNKLVFKEPPEQAASIAVEYRDAATSLLDKFPLSKLPSPDTTVSIKVNGLPVSDVTLDLASKEVSFASPPPDGASLVFTYQTDLGPKSLYRVFEAKKDMTVLGVTTEEEPTTFLPSFSVSDTGIVTMKDPAYFEKDKTLKVQVESPLAASSMQLPHLPIPGSVKIMESPCPLEKGLVTVNGDQLQVNCQVTDQPIKIAFQYESEIKSSFELESQPIKSSQVAVLVNGIATTQYTIAGNILTIDEAMSAASTIEYREIRNPQNRN